VIFFIAIIVLMFILLRYTKFGRKTYAIGGNENAAYLAGIKVRLHKVIIYSINGLIVGFASQVLLSRLGSAIPVMGAGFELQSIAAAVIGGVALSGGKGSIWGCFIGVLLLGIISNSLNVLRISSFYQDIVLGAIIVGAVVISNIGAKKK
jgi:ribose/xylose/arabinose/galactoside ABC-type transport system permease subunit